MSATGTTRGSVGAFEGRGGGVATGARACWRVAAPSTRERRSAAGSSLNEAADDEAISRGVRVREGASAAHGEEALEGWRRREGVERRQRRGSRARRATMKRARRRRIRKRVARDLSTNGHTRNERDARGARGRLGRDDGRGKRDGRTFCRRVRSRGARGSRACNEAPSRKSALKAKKVSERPFVPRHNSSSPIETTLLWV
eukprot:30992-Pelagococcus_subviridis.AAC.9